MKPIILEGEITFHVASKEPRTDIELLAFPGQKEDHKMYRPGYEHYFNNMPDFFQEK